MNDIRYDIHLTRTQIIVILSALFSDATRFPLKSEENLAICLHLIRSFVYSDYYKDKNAVR